ncbi:proline--tRNA ligase [Candidatus Poribacteria bacterium]|nr:proline--tRNA ligase [Candidatus Poribacteria bacterium]
MRMSKLFIQTLKETPSEAEIPSHQLMLRAGMIRRLATGMYTHLPLAQRSLQKIEGIIRQEMDAIDGQEINMPLVHPAELWDESGRLEPLVGKELVGFNDRFGRHLVLAMTHEEAVTDLVRNQVNSYRQLPLMLYQIKLKFRDEPRPRAGLIRVREFVMKDAYSFHVDQADLDQYYDQIYQAYLNIFNRTGIEVVVVESDTGMIGGSAAHEFMLITESGEDNLIISENGEYTANAEVAVHKKANIDNGIPLQIEEIETPGQKTIEEVSNFLGIHKSQTLKAVFYVTNDSLIFAAIRGDFEVNETKLANALNTPIRIASSEEVEQYNLVAGYASPIDLENVTVIIDDSVANTTNLVAGANKPEYHLKNVNYPRDFKADIVTDIALAQDNDTCYFTGGKLIAKKGIEVGNIFKLGTKYSDAMKAYYLDQHGKTKPIVMGCYGIGVGRLLASVVEANHDENGIVFPVSICPYEIHLMSIGKDNQVIETAETLYKNLQENGYEVLYDDRNESAGFKFKEADLIGLPIRIAISNRTLQNNAVEVKLRSEEDRQIIGLNQLDLKPYFDRIT